MAAEAIAQLMLPPGIRSKEERKTRSFVHLYVFKIPPVPAQSLQMFTNYANGTWSIHAVTHTYMPAVAHQLVELWTFLHMTTQGTQGLIHNGLPGINEMTFYKQS